MYFRVLIVVTLLKLSECHNSLFGTAELRNPQPRRSRLLSDFVNSNVPNDNSRSAFVPMSIPIKLSRSLPVSSTTIESVQSTASTSSSENSEGPVPTADTMRKYARILKIDAENMNDEQRELLLRIVQRIARLNGANPDEESIDLNVNEGRARRKHRDDRKKKKPSPASDVVADSTKGNAITTSKHRTTPSSGSTKKKVASSSNFIAISTVTAASPTQPTIATKVGKSKVTQANDLTLTNATSMDLGNISTTSIVDVLSTDNARENFYIRRPSPSTITTLHNKIQPQKVSICANSNFIILHAKFKVVIITQKEANPTTTTTKIGNNFLWHL